MKRRLVIALLLCGCSSTDSRTPVPSPGAAALSTAESSTPLELVDAASGEPQESRELPELRAELLAMLEVDQMIRAQGHQVANCPAAEPTAEHDHTAPHPTHGDEMLVVHGGETRTIHPDEIVLVHGDEMPAGAVPIAPTHGGHAHGDEMHRVDATNTARLKEIVDEYGWPGRSLVGEEAACAAFLIAQHADADPEFQVRCLELMRAAPDGEVSSGDIAYLTDRIRVNTGRPQVYGTQFWAPNGTLVPRPIEDEERLGERRREAGLIPMEEYRQHMQSHQRGSHDH